jgi:transposase
MKWIYVLGIDISMDDFHVCLKEKDSSGRVRVLGSRTFSNTSGGFESLLVWLNKFRGTDGVQCVMEATGSYYEELAYFLHGLGRHVCVVLPNKVKHFAKSLNVKSKTDKLDADTIAQVGIERNLPRWTPMSPQWKGLRDLCRERLSLKKELSRAKCQLHAIRHSHDKNQAVVDCKLRQIDFYENAIGDLEYEIERSIRSDEVLTARIANIERVKGLGLITIITILCETNGFLTFSSISQVASYAGLDVEFKESGKYKGRTRISKKGNARIRQCLYMPALTATQHDQNIRSLYERIVERNPTVKRKGVVAAMRKLLVLTYVLWKKNEEYDVNYRWK